MAGRRLPQCISLAWADREITARDRLCAGGRGGGASKHALACFACRSKAQRALRLPGSMSASAWLSRFVVDAAATTQQQRATAGRLHMLRAIAAKLDVSVGDRATAVNDGKVTGLSFCWYSCVAGRTCSSQASQS